MFKRDSSPRAICSENRNYEQVFKKFGIAPMSGEPIGTLFSEPDFVITLLEALDDPTQLDAERFVHFGTMTVIDYLKHSHRYYLEVWVPEITHLLQHLVSLSAGAHPMLLALPAFWRSYRFELQQHFHMEEKELFPYATLLYKKMHGGEHLRVFTDDLKGHSLEGFMHDHVDEAEELAEIRSLLRKYTDRDSGAFPYRILLHKLRLFEQDLRVHAFLEDEVLVPRLRTYQTQLRALLN